MTEGLHYEDNEAARLEHERRVLYPDEVTADVRSRARGAEMNSEDLEIGRDPGGNTDFADYMTRAIERAAAGREIRILLHGRPVAVLRLYEEETGSNDK